MCGICGVFDNTGRVTHISKMNQAQRHRGPDDEGYIFVNSHTGKWQIAGGADTTRDSGLIHHGQIDASESFDLALGSRRLAILDLSPAGHMPMSYQNENLWLVHNGEIYNYVEIRLELRAKGYVFRSDSDTEVIMAAYLEWGVECLSRFNGMFAFALWDKTKNSLFCARDRFGIKPFNYYWNGSSFVFASEIKSLLQHPAIPKEPNDQIIFQYLALGRSDHTNQTFFKDIHVLLPGHYITVDLTSGNLVKQRWWDVTINTSIDANFDNGDQVVYDKFTELLKDAIRLRLRSDVAVGSCLSGGLDSSSIVYLMNQLLVNEQVIPKSLVGEHQKTFTARNNEAEIDEYKFSRLVIEQTGAEENITFPNGDVLWKELDTFLWHMDEPIDSTSQYLQWNVMRLARERGVTVLLDGQGGDEILAGYYAYIPHYLNQIKRQRGVLAMLRACWDVARIGGWPVVNTIIDDIYNRLPWRLQQILKFIKPAYSLPGGGGSGVKDSQLSPEFLKKFWDQRWQPPHMSESGLAGVLYRDITSTNLPKLLRYEDRNSMAFSLEARLPFLDYRLVEMVLSLPLDYRIHQGWSKWILRYSLSQTLSPLIGWRRSKLGFPTPEVKWLKQGSGDIRQLLQRHESGKLAKYIQPAVIRQIYSQPDNEMATTPGLWRMINLAKWLDLFFDDKPVLA